MSKNLLQNSLRVQVERLWRIITILIFLISIVGMPTTVAKADTEPELVGYWRFDETSGTTADDSSTYGNDGTLVSGATWMTGIEGGAVSFDGSNDSVQIPNSASLSLNTNQVTFTGWIYPTNLSGNWITIIQRSHAAGTFFDWQIYARASDAPTEFHPVFRVDWNMNNLNEYDEEVEGDIVLQADTWYYITATYDGTAMKFYIDGTLRGTTAKIGGVIPNSNESAWIGGNDSWGEYFTGKIDEFRIYNKALNQTEIQELMVQRSLTVNVVGSGSVANNPDKITYNDGEVVALSATPAAGWSFSSWSGACTGPGACSVTMDADKSVTATFTQNEYTLTVNTVGSGSVTRSNPGPYHLGDVVNLTPVPVTGWAFSNWSGVCTGLGACSVTMDADKTVTATFTQNEYTLTVNTVGSGSVTRSNPGPYHLGDVVNLTPVPASGWSFTTWSGDCTGSGACSVTMDANKSVTATFTQTSTGPANIEVHIGGTLQGSYLLDSGESMRQNYAGLDSGPVKVASTNAVPIISAIRDAWAVNGVTTSFSQLMGLPQELLSNKYVFPGYNNVTLNEQLRIANVDTVQTTVTVTIGGVLQGTYTLYPPGSLLGPSAVRVNYPGLDSGPVVVEGTAGVDIISAIRDAWAVNGVTKSFIQFMGLPAGQLSDKYVFPAYNNVTLNEQLRIANVDTVPSTVTVTIGGVLQGTYTLYPPGSLLGPSAVRVNYAGLDSGPVIVEGTAGVDIISSIRDAWAVNGVTTSFSQLMGVPAEQLANKYVFPAYNNVTLNDQLRISNVDTVQTTVTVTIGGVLQGTYTLYPPGSLLGPSAVRVNYAGLDSGPVVVEGTAGVEIISAIREAWAVNGVTQSFVQLMGLPAGQLSSTYLFPAYNNVTLNEQLRFGVP